MDCWIGVLGQRSGSDIPQCVFLSEEDARQWVAQDPTPDYAYWEWRDVVKAPLIVDTAALNRLRGDE